MRTRQVVTIVLVALITIGLVGAAAGCSRRTFRDGEFAGTSEKGDVTVTLTLKNDKIVAVNIVELDRNGNPKDIATYLMPVGDTREPLLAVVHPTMAERIMKNNTWDVDTFTGATSSADQIREAARAALTAAKQ